MEQKTEKDEGRKVTIDGELEKRPAEPECKFPRLRGIWGAWPQVSQQTDKSVVKIRAADSIEETGDNDWLLKWERYNCLP